MSICECGNTHIEHHGVEWYSYKDVCVIEFELIALVDELRTTHGKLLADMNDYCRAEQGGS